MFNQCPNLHIQGVMHFGRWGWSKKYQQGKEGGTQRMRMLKELISKFQNLTPQ
jgi:hypothetical protein